jgi:hypothetical protein
MNQRGIAAKTLTTLLLWVLLAILVGYSVIYLLKKIGLI